MADGFQHWEIGCGVRIGVGGGEIDSVAFGESADGFGLARAVGIEVEFPRVAAIGA